MRIIIRLLSILIILILIVLVAAGGAAVYTIRKAFPDVGGERRGGVQARVDVIRDRSGVPHIYAENEHDLYYTMGYVQAQDRFWQMEFFRRIGQGRLSEILGGSTAGTDRYLRTLGLHRAAAAEVAQLDDEERAGLQAYADGVNAYMAANKGNLGLEFTLLGLSGVTFDPEPWTPVNSLTWVKMMAQDLGGNMTSEILRMRMIQAIGPEKTAQLLPVDYPAGKPVILPSAARFDGVDAMALLQDIEGYRALRGLAGEGLGSNNWVVAGSHTSTGKPFVANDPHLGIQMPALWYEVDLQCVELTPQCRIQVAGFSFPGVPGVVLGHNQRIAWGFTNVNPDVQDLYVEELSGDAVRFNDQLVPLQIVEEKIIVDGKLPESYEARANESTVYDEASGRTTITLKVRIVPHHGPLMSDVDGSLAESGKALSLKWTALEPGRMIQMVMRLNRAQNWDEMRDALSYWQAPSQNVVFADVDGHIGWQVPGDVPVRPAGCDGLLPAPGDGSCEWQGYVPYDELPRSFDPAQGWIATANNAPYGAGYPHVLGLEWDPGWRAQRIVELLSAKDTFTIDDMAAIQLDSKDVFAGEIIPLLADFTPADARSKELLSALRNWDLVAGRNNPGESIFASFHVNLVENLFGDELGDELGPEYRGQTDHNRVVLARMIGDAASPWWDAAGTPDVETRAHILELTFKDVDAELTPRLGQDISTWTWGRLHTATFENQSLGQSDALGGLLKTLLNRGPVPVDGGGNIVNATSWATGGPARYTVRALPSLRAVYDLADFNNSRVMHTTGQSGHPYHPHYDDFIQQWADGKYHQLWWDRGVVEREAEGHMVLLP